jgi:DNA-binding response OmpR family regulator
MKMADNILRETVAAMNPDAAVNFLLDYIEALTTAGDTSPAHDNMTRLESRIMNRLLLSESDVVTRDQLMTAMYFDRQPHDWPEAKIVDVKICALRTKVPSNNNIETVWGRGYRLVRG